ncbi:MAG: flavodoxin family protein, partial [Deltaproteobacteria bacterium]|nr:flavodoxin family protein [Deltaproteobacteria bacterium]
NSYYLLDKALAEARKIIPDAEVEAYTFAKKTFGGCLHCYGCRKKGQEGQCAIEDDFQDLADLWVEAEVIIYSVPVYHMSIPGQLKCFIDRLGQSGITRLVPAEGQSSFIKPLKCVGIISQGMHIFSGQEQAIAELVNHALLMGCLPIAGNLWQGYIGASGWTECLADKNAIEQLDSQGTISARAAVDAAQSLGRNVAQLALVIQAGRQAVLG